jgi:hypothetical protein
MQRLIKFFGNEPEVETLFERVSGHTAETLREKLRIAEFAARAHLRAARTGFHVASVHSIAERSLIVNQSTS